MCMLPTSQVNGIRDSMSSPYSVLMILRPPSATRSDTRVPYTTRFRSPQRGPRRRVALQRQAWLAHTLREVSPARVGNPELDGPKPRRTHPLAVPIYLVSPLLDRGHVNLHRYHAKLHDTSLTAPPQVPSLRFASGVPQGRRRAFGWHKSHPQ